MRGLVIANVERQHMSFVEHTEAALARNDVGHDVISHHDMAEADYRKYGLVVMTGAPVIPDYPNELLTERTARMSWFKNDDTPLIYGICMGFQNIGVLFGSEVREDEAEDGVREITPARNELLFHGLPGKFNVLSTHNASITTPPNFVTIGSSEHCQNHFMRNEAGTIYGGQSHIEMPESLPAGELIMKNLVELARARNI